MESKFIIGAFGIILNEHKQVLLCHRRDYDLWNLPGGRLKDRESPWDGVKREIEEETGLKVEIIKLLGIYSKSEKMKLFFLSCAKQSLARYQLAMKQTKSNIL